jgi:hypothetical protein
VFKAYFRAALAVRIAAQNMRGLEQSCRLCARAILCLSSDAGPESTDLKMASPPGHVHTPPLLTVPEHAEADSPPSGATGGAPEIPTFPVAANAAQMTQCRACARCNRARVGGSTPPFHAMVQWEFIGIHSRRCSDHKKTTERCWFFPAWG